MIDVCIRKYGEHYTEVYVEGHAGYANRGKDIVCAGVSALTYNLINSMNSFTNDHVAYDELKDAILIRFKNLSKEGILLVDSFFLGILSIHEQYPDYVKVNAQNMKA